MVLDRRRILKPVDNYWRIRATIVPWRPMKMEGSNSQLVGSDSASVPCQIEASKACSHGCGEAGANNV